MTCFLLPDLTSTDLITIDGQGHRFVGQSQSGLLFAPVSKGGANLTELLTRDLPRLMLEPGRVIVQREYYKSGRRK